MNIFHQFSSGTGTTSISLMTTLRVLLSLLIVLLSVSVDVGCARGDGNVYSKLTRNGSNFIRPIAVGKVSPVSPGKVFTNVISRNLFSNSTFTEDDLLEQEAVVISKLLGGSLKVVEHSLVIVTMSLKAGGDTFITLASGVLKVVSGMFSYAGRKSALASKSIREARYDDDDQENLANVRVQLATALNNSAVIFNGIGRLLVWNAEMIEMLAAGLIESLQDSFKSLKVIPVVLRKAIQLVLYRQDEAGGTAASLATGSADGLPATSDGNGNNTLSSTCESKSTDRTKSILGRGCHHAEEEPTSMMAPSSSRSPSNKPVQLIATNLTVVQGVSVSSLQLKEAVSAGNNTECMFSTGSTVSADTAFPSSSSLVDVLVTLYQDFADLASSFSDEVISASTSNLNTIAGIWQAIGSTVYMLLHAYVLIPFGIPLWDTTNGSVMQSELLLIDEYLSMLPVFLLGLFIVQISFRLICNHYGTILALFRAIIVLLVWVLLVQVERTRVKRVVTRAGIRAVHSFLADQTIRFSESMDNFRDRHHTPGTGMGRSSSMPFSSYVFGDYSKDCGVNFICHDGTHWCNKCSQVSGNHERHATVSREIDRLSMMKEHTGNRNNNTVPVPVWENSAWVNIALSALWNIGASPTNSKSQMGGGHQKYKRDDILASLFRTIPFSEALNRIRIADNSIKRLARKILPSSWIGNCSDSAANSSGQFPHYQKKSEDVSHGGEGGIGPYTSEVFRLMIIESLAAVPSGVGTIYLKRFDLGSTPPLMKAVSVRRRRLDTGTADNPPKCGENSNFSSDNSKNDATYSQGRRHQQHVHPLFREFEPECERIDLELDFVFDSKDIDVAFAVSLRSRVDLSTAFPLSGDIDNRGDGNIGNSESASSSGSPTASDSVVPEAVITLSEIVLSGKVKFEIELTNDYPFVGNATVTNI